MCRSRSRAVSYTDGQTCHRLPSFGQSMDGSVLYGFPICMFPISSSILALLLVDVPE